MHLNASKLTQLSLALVVERDGTVEHRQDSSILNIAGVRRARITHESQYRSEIQSPSHRTEGEPPARSRSMKSTSLDFLTGRPVSQLPECASHAANLDIIPSPSSLGSCRDPPIPKKIDAIVSLSLFPEDSASKTSLCSLN